jgi:putative heme-binding domain-containing protein
MRTGLLPVMMVCVSWAAPAMRAQQTLPKIEPLSSASEEDLARGKRLYQGQCAQCHGPQGNGGTGANLAQPKLIRAATDEALVRVIRDGIPGTDMPPAPAMVERELWLTAAYVRTLGDVPMEKVPGDPERGRAVYNGKGGCPACHTMQGRGGRYGPELGEIGARRSAAHLRQSILDPEADFTERYAFVRVTLPGGKTISGIKLNEDTFSVQLIDASEKIHSFWKKDTQRVEILRNLSPMPSYRSTLSASELDDLIAYLVTLRGEQ